MPQRRRRHLAGALAWTFGRCLARRAERPGNAVAERIGAAADDAAGAATRAASEVGALYLALAAGMSAFSETQTLRARNRIPLPSLHELHPEASRLPVRSLGLQEVNVSDIAGTAVAGPDQRGSDFRPLPPFRGSDWHARWLRIRTALARMEPLPPVDLQKYDDRYWVLDGHNRIAAALYEGQLVVDAVVQELVPPGSPPPTERPSMALEMAEGTAIRTAATGVTASLALRRELESGITRPDVRTRESEGTNSQAGATQREADEAGAERASGNPAT